MSARQNKKRKGRTVTNRERTVTTLTKDPNTPYLVPTPSEDPPSANIMSSPFSVASSSGANQPNMSPTAFPFSGSYGFQYNNYMPTLHTQQAQQFFQPNPALPPGQSDLEILENLKKAIKDGQHDFYQAIPQPDVLASMYLGPAQKSRVHLPEQISDQHNMAYPNALAYNNDGSQSDLLAHCGAISITSSTDSNNRVLPSQAYTEEPSTVSDNNIQSKVESPSTSAQHKPTNAPLASTSLTVPSATPDHRRSLQNHQNSPVQAQAHHFSDSRAAQSSPISVIPPSSNNSRRHSLDMKPSPGPGGRTNSELPSPSQTSTKFNESETDSSKPFGEQTSPNQSYEQSEGNIDVSSSSNLISTGFQNPAAPAHLPDSERDSLGPDWHNRQPPPYRPVQAPVRDSRPQIRRASFPDTNAGLNVAPDHLPGSRDSKYMEREKERDFEHDRDWDAHARDRDRSFDHRFRDDRPGADFRRTPVEPRHIQNKYSSHRGSDAREPPSSDKRPDHGANSDHDGTAAAANDSLPTNDRITPSSDEPHVRGPVSASDRHTRPIPTQDRYVSGDRTTRPTVAAPTRARDVAQRPIGTEHPAGLALLEDKRSQSVVPVDERGNRPPQSLQDRLSQPPQATRSESGHTARMPSLEERLSDANPATSLTPSSENRSAHSKKTHGVNGAEHARTGDERSQMPEPGQASPSTRERTLPPEEHPTRPGISDRERHSRPALMSRYGNAMQPPGSEHYEERHLHQRTSIPRPPARPYRPGPDSVRDRPDMRNGHRALPGGYPDNMDIDAPPRLNHSRTLYNRPTSPPTAPDHVRDRPRVPFSHLPPSSHSVGEALPYDAELDRRYTSPGDRRELGYQGPYNDRGREYAAFPTSYWMSQPRRFAPPSPDRNIGWEERERRPPFPNHPPITRSSFDTAPHRSLGSRLTDEYSGPGSSTSLEDRVFTRNIDRTRYYSPVGSPPPILHSRVRMRSPSPMDRRMPGPSDDMRSPMKRARVEVPPYAPAYYLPSSRELNRRSSFASDYSQRVTTPPPPSSGGSYYDSMARPPPTTGSSTGGSERPYMGPRDGGGPGLEHGAYNRRSPPLPPTRVAGPPPMTYGRGRYGRSDPRDDRRMNMAPPPPRTA